MRQRMLFLLVLFSLLGFATARADIARPSNAVVFASNVDGDYDLYVWNVTTGVASPLTFNDTDDLTPRWSPDGKSIVYISKQDGDWDVYVMDSDGSGIYSLTNNTSDDLYPDWSPDGKQITYTSNAKRSWDVFVMNVNGRGTPIQLTSSDFYEGNPVWSPDGKQIAYVFDRDSKRELMVMNSDGSNVRQVTHNSAADFSPAWSPDGRELLFLSGRGVGNAEIYRLPINCLESDTCEQDALNISHDAGSEVDPAWSPDGNQIIFGSGRDGVGTELYIMNADGSGLTRLTNNGADDRMPNWWQG